MAVIDLQFDFSRTLNSGGFPVYNASIIPALSEYKGYGYFNSYPLYITGVDNAPNFEFVDLNAAKTWYIATFAQAYIDFLNTDWGTSHTLGQTIAFTDRLVNGTFALASHTHVANDISNATTVGKNVLTAATQSAARTALGAGTSSFSGDYNDLVNKPTIPTTATFYNGTSLVSNPKIVQKTGTTGSGGVATFFLTNDNTSTGTALLANVHSVNIDVNSSTAAYGYSWALSNSNRTLTVTVTQPTSLLSLGLLPNVAAASGVPVNVRVFGN